MKKTLIDYLLRGLLITILLAGCAGKNGAQGPAGTNGTNGTNGANGSQGTQGPQGLTGPTMPVIQSLTVQGLPATPGSPVTTTVVAQSAQGLGLTYTWTTSSGWVISSGGNASMAIITAPSGYGITGTATIEISDTNGMYAMGVIALSTQGEIAPVVNSITASPNPSPRNGTITALVNASDAQGNTISYTWIVTTGWTVTGYGTTATVIAPDTYNTGGYLTVTASDNYGGAATATVALSTQADSPPAISSITASPNPIAINGTMAISVSATDPNGDSLSYNWAVPAGWTISSGQGTAQINVTAPNSYANNGIVYVTVSDGYGGIVNGSIAVSTEGDIYPVISSITASPNPTVPNGTITALVNASDSEGNTLSYTWTATTGWEVTGYGATATVIAPSTYNTGGNITVTVSDGFGGIVDATIAVSTVANIIPVINSIEVFPNPVSSGALATVSASAEDPDGNSLTYTWNVPADWTIQSGQGTSQIVVLAPTQYAVGGNITVTVNDGYGGIASGSIYIDTINDSYPVINNLSAAPSIVEPNGTATAIVSAYDPDGNTLSYTWGASQGWTVTGNGTTATVTAPNTYNTIGYITATVSDGFGMAVTATVALNTANVLPPSPPTNLTATPGYTKVSLTWTASTGATSYEIYGSAISGGSYTPVGITTTTGYTVTSLTNGTTYYFVVTAVNSGGTSGYSNQASATPQLITYSYDIGLESEGIAIDANGDIWVGSFNTTTTTELSSTGITLGTYNVGGASGGIAIDSSGNVWVANWGSTNVTELNSSGTTIGTYAVGTSPSGIAIDSSGNVWVSNHGSNNVTKLSSTGVTIGTYQVGLNPRGIAIDANGDVWVANSGTNTVTKLSAIGITLGTYNVGSLPEAIAIDANGDAWVTNYGSLNVTKLSSTGITLGTYSVSSGPVGIAIDASGNVWVANDGNTVTELSSTGIAIGTYSSSTNPRGIAIDANGDVWVSNYHSNNVTELVGITTGPQYFPYTGPQFTGGGNF